MGAMLDSMQVSDKEMLVMSKNLTALAGDMASFYNLNSDETFQKIRAGISGEIEPLRQLGINMSVANLENYALSQGITKSYKAMTQNEQAILRYNYLLSVTANAQGDFVRTQDSWANQTRILTERFNELKIVLGNLIINVLTPCISVLNELISTALVFAKTLADSLGIEPAISSDGITATVENQQNLAEATENATEAQKEQNKAFAAFDKLNDISKTSNTTSSAGGSSGTTNMGVNSYSSQSTGLDTTVISETLEEILVIVGGAVLAIGVLLAIYGSLPMGIALIALGAASLTSAVAIDNQKLTDDVITQLDLIAAYISGVVLLLGILLAVVSPSTLGIGIGLIVAGVAGLATTVAVNWNATSDEMKNTLTAMLAIISASILVIGVLLCIAGMYGLGVGLIIAGVAGLATVVAFNWDTIVNKVTTVCAKIKNALIGFGANVKSWFFGLINGGISCFEGFVNGIINGFNWVIKKLNSFRINIPSWVPKYGGSSIGFNLNEWKPISIPRLATGAVIPARSEFLAVLGDQKHGRNLEAPEGLIRQIVREESSSITYEDLRAAFYAALLMAKQNGILDFDINMDARKVGQATAKHVGKELNRSGFVFRTAKG